MRDMRVVYFTKTSEVGPASRYRVYQFLPWLQQAGISYSIRPLFGSTYFSLLEIRPQIISTIARALYAAVRGIQRLWDLATMGKPDLIVVEGQLLPYCPSWIERILARRGHRLAVEFDDAIYLTRFHEKKMPQLLKISTAAIVGNRTLAKYAQRFTSSVRVIPTVVDTERFVPLQASTVALPGETVNAVTIVWIGLAYNFSYLDALIPAIRHMQQQFNARFRVISSRAPILPGVDVEFIPWDLQSEVTRLQECQIGVMPLPDNEWAKGKCGLKLLQYMSLGMASVASPIGVNQDIIQDGVNGFLAATEHEWYDRLLRLCENPQLRERVGREARQTVVDRYSLDVWAPRLIACYRSLSDMTPARPPATTSPKAA